MARHARDRLRRSLVRLLSRPPESGPAAREPQDGKSRVGHKCDCVEGLPFAAVAASKTVEFHRVHGFELTRLDPHQGPIRHYLHVLAVSQPSILVRRKPVCA